MHRTLQTDDFWPADIFEMSLLAGCLAHAEEGEYTFVHAPDTNTIIATGKVIIIPSAPRAEGCIGSFRMTTVQCHDNVCNSESTGTTLIHNKVFATSHRAVNTKPLVLSKGLKRVNSEVYAF